MKRKPLHIQLGPSVYRWDDDTGWRHVEGPTVDAFALPPVPPSHVPDAAGHMAAVPGYLAPWHVAQAPTPQPADDELEKAADGPTVF
jgi:hypothetical protein